MPDHAAALPYSTLPGRVFLLLAAILAPLAGSLLTDLPWESLTAFPPDTLYVAHHGFSWLAFAVTTLFTACCVGPFVFIFFKKRNETGKVQTGISKRFPPYGCLAAAFLSLSWVIAWTRFPLLAWLQHHTFFPLWLSFTFLVLSLAESAGLSPLRARTLRFFSLFPLSTVTWWYFEYLNRYVQNWTYQNISEFSPLEYFFFASLSFSTVLPAMAAVERLLKALPGFFVFRQLRPIPFLHSTSARVVLISFSIATLFLLPLFHDYLFPLVWISPLLMLLALFGSEDSPSLLSDAARGDWSSIIRWSAAGLVCGFFWEMWNYWSLARWVYHIPFVGRFHFFEMPLLGYAGYLPFGIFCGAIIEKFMCGLSGNRA